MLLPLGFGDLRVDQSAEIDDGRIVFNTVDFGEKEIHMTSFFFLFDS